MITVLIIDILSYNTIYSVKETCGSDGDWVKDELGGTRTCSGTCLTVLSGIVKHT